MKGDTTRRKKRLNEAVFFGGRYYANSEKIIVSEKYYDFLIQSNSRLEEHESSNLTYYYNYENAPNENYFWLDLIVGDNLYLNPPPPTRDEYAFVGWYLEPECETEWDGILPTLEDEKLELYAKWNMA